MDKYIIVTTLCDKKEIADQICNALLDKKLVAGCQIVKKESIYWWNSAIERDDEFHLEFRTKLSLYEIIEKEIKEIHDYEVPEISYYEISGGAKEFFEWIDSEIN